MLDCQKDVFYLPSDITYLNHGYMSPALHSVQEAGIQGLMQQRLPYQIQAQDFFKPSEPIRQIFARLIRCDDPERIVLIPSASYGLANAAKNIRIQSGENIVLPEGQFPSNVYSWHRLAQEKNAFIKTVKAPKEYAQRGKKWNEAILEAIDSKTRLVALGNIHWADGTRFELKAIRQRAREVGALLVIDGTQSIGALPFDLSDIQPDALICAAYKWLLGPYSIGLAYYGEYFDEGTPIEESWMNRLGSDEFSALVNQQDGYRPKAIRYEVGEHSNFILLPMLKKALEQIEHWGISNIQAYCKALNRKALGTLSEWGFRIEDEEYRASHMLGIRFPDEVDPEKLKSTLMKHNIYVSFRGDAVRVSFHLYNDEKDMERLLSALKNSF